MKILLLHDVQADKQNGVSVSLGILLRELQTQRSTVLRSESADFG